MEPTERIEVRNIYVSNAAIFGILYGLCLGVIVALFVLIAGLITPEGYQLFGVVYGASVGSLVLVTFLAFLFTTVGVFLGSIVKSLIYNFVARSGGKLTIGLAQYVPPVKKPKKLKLSKKHEKHIGHEKPTLRPSSLKAADYMHFDTKSKK